MADLNLLLEQLVAGNDTLAEQSALALVQHGESARERLRPLLQSPVVDHRWWAIRTLGAMQNPEASSMVVYSLRDPQPEVRQCAALVLRESPSRDALAALIQLLGDRDRLTARLAGDALAAMGPSAVNSLAIASKDSNPEVRIEAARALAEMEDEAAIGPLFLAIDDPSSMVSHWAEEGLDRLGIGMVFFQP